MGGCRLSHGHPEALRPRLNGMQAWPRVVILQTAYGDDLCPNLRPTSMHWFRRTALELWSHDIMFWDYLEFVFGFWMPILLSASWGYRTSFMVPVGAQTSRTGQLLFHSSITAFTFCVKCTDRLPVHWNKQAFVFFFFLILSFCSAWNLICNVICKSQFSTGVCCGLYLSDKHFWPA